MNTKPSKRGLIRFEYFARCEDSNRLLKIPFDASGFTAAECFCFHETHGRMLPCKEPDTLSRSLNGKAWHGVTVTAIAEDYVGRMLFAEDLAFYPPWVQRDILGRASQIAIKQIGFVPTFVRTGQDFTTLDMDKFFIDCAVCKPKVIY